MEVMSCERMEKQILPYVDGRLKESERAEVEKHLAGCAACRLRVNAFRAVGSLLEELPQIEPSPAFDVRVHARVAAEPKRRNWLGWLTPSPRVAIAASLLLLATVWVARRQQTSLANPENLSPDAQYQLIQNLPVLEDYDVLSNFDPLADLPPPVQQPGTADQQNQPM
jgi:anti-sigma factor RsiW